MRLSSDSQRSLEGFILGFVVGSSIAIAVAILSKKKLEDLTFGSFAEVLAGLVAFGIGAYSLSVAREVQRRQRRAEEKAEYIALLKVRPPLLKIRGLMGVLGYSLKPRREGVSYPEEIIRICRNLIDMDPEALIRGGSIDSDLPLSSSRVVHSLRIRSEAWVTQLERFCKKAAALLENWRMLQAKAWTDDGDLVSHEAEVDDLRITVLEYIQFCLNDVSDAVEAINTDLGVFDMGMLEREWRKNVLHRSGFE